MSIFDRPSVKRLVEVVEDRTGYKLADSKHVELLEAEARDKRLLQRDLDLLAWTALNEAPGGAKDLKHEDRIKLSRKAQYVWERDPQAGAIVRLHNDFVFGRGLPKPKCHDPKVQEIVDEAWDDPDNQRILTSTEAQEALGVDLCLQANVFPLLFDDGADGKVKLGLLDFETVEDAVRDPNFRQRILYYKATVVEYAWDYKEDRPVTKTALQEGGKPKVVYYEHWENVQVAEEQGQTVQKPPASKLGAGRVYHLRINRTSEMAFGVPEFRRLINWFNAYNAFMEARVDMAQAAAAYIMKRKVDGTKSQLEKMATQMLSRRSDLGASSINDPSGGDIMRGPAPASILAETKGVTHEDFSLNTQSGNALQDGQMIRAQISAGQFPQHYLGDVGNANLATATSMELPVLKHIENRQEAFEGLFRWFIDRVIEKAIEDGKLPEDLTPEELDEKRRREELEKNKGKKPEEEQPFGAAQPEDQQYAMLQAHQEEVPEGEVPEDAPANGKVPAKAEADEELPEEDTKRDLGYDFSMPNPIRKMLTDLVTAISNIAKTFDPNGTNVELSRALLTIALGEGLEVEDPAALVERIFPPGYEDPLVAQAREQPPNPFVMANPFEPQPGSGPPDPANPYSVKQQPMPGSATGKKGLFEARFADVPKAIRERALSRAADVESMFDRDVSDVALRHIEQLAQANGGKRKHS